MKRIASPAIALLAAAVAPPGASAQALGGAATTASLWRVQVGSTTQLRAAGQPIGWPSPSWQLIVPHVSGSSGTSIAQFGIAEQYAVEERLRLTNGVTGSIGTHETVLTWTATRAVAFELRLAASVARTGLTTGVGGRAEIDVGDDGSFELSAGPGETRQRTIPTSMGPGTLRIRTRTAIQGTGADPGRLAEIAANTTVIAMFAPASWLPVGAGCAGSAGIPGLAPLADQRPWAGETFTVVVQNLPPVPVLGLLGLSAASWGGLQLPLDLGPVGMPGCTLYSDVQGTWPLSATGGQANWPVPIPADIGLVGGIFLQQALALDRNANAFGATVSNAGRATVGTRNR